MTRINLVPPSELMDQHLMAEYREIKMIARSLRRSIQARGIEGALKIIPAEFTLGKGHVSFFYDKAIYINSRYAWLQYELLERGFNLSDVADSSADRMGVWLALPQVYWKDYKPTEKALATVRERIASRIAEKPNWYRKTPRQ